MFGNLAALTARQDDSNKPREPPPPATPLDFPRCEPSKLPASERGVSNDLVKLFSSTLRTGPTPKHLQALNVQIENELSLHQVVPTDFLPHASWSNAPTTSGSSGSAQAEVPKPVSLSNGAQAPGKEDFFIRAKELLYDNEDAFRAIQRQPPIPNRQPARVVHFRKFWDGLLMMADHWDTSLDKYLDIEDTEDEPMTDIDDAQSEPIRAGEKKGADEARDLKKKTYTGRRTGTGRDMPSKYREDTTFSFVETLAGAFRCRLNQPRSQQRLKLQGTMIPILHAASVVRVPKAVREARKGISEGPMLGVFCREQTSFRDPDEAEGEGKQEILDLLRETGLMLMLAQKRAREGKEEEVPGKDKWWANAPRWGGGEGGEPGATDDENTGDATTSGSARKQSKKASRTDAWKSMQPPSSIWEKGVTYQRIGKDRSSEYDDIYLVSSINHHISIVHLHIHQDYIKHLDQTPAQSRSSEAPQQPWYLLDVKRSKWFDLLVAEDRVETMRGIWAILSWQMRNMPEEKEEVKESTV